MPLTIPPFAQFQAPMFPLRGLWNAKPAEGDRFVNAEINWQIETGNTGAVQFSLSGNSPVALSQIAALYVDNGRCGADVAFLFPDSGFQIVVPAHSQGLYPVLTNALMFYALAPTSASGDATILQILNSSCPPIPLTATSARSNVSVSGILLASNATTQLVAATVSGVLNAMSIVVSEVSGASAAVANLNLIDGKARLIWATQLALPASQSATVPIDVPNINVRFYSGLSLTVSSSTFTGGAIIANLYFTAP